MNSKSVNKSAPVVESQEIKINAPIELVWSILAELEHWPGWNESVTKITVAGPVSEGTKFEWVASGTKIKSRIEEIKNPDRIVWSGTTMGIKAIHTWDLAADNNGTHVRTEESFEGLVVRFFAGRMRKMLLDTLTQVLKALKQEAERRFGENQWKRV